MLLGKDDVPTRQQVDIVEAFFEDLPRLEDAVAFVAVVDNKELVGVVPDQVELAKLVVDLDVGRGEAQRVFDVALEVFLFASHIE